MTEREFEDFIKDLVEEAKAVELGVADRVEYIRSFEDAGLLTGNAGLVVRLDDGSEFQVTIVRSR